MDGESVLKAGWHAWLIPLAGRVRRKPARELFDGSKPKNATAKRTGWYCLDIHELQGRGRSVRSEGEIDLEAAIAEAECMLADGMKRVEIGACRLPIDAPDVWPLVCADEQHEPTAASETGGLAGERPTLGARSRPALE